MFEWLCNLLTALVYGSEIYIDLNQLYQNLNRYQANHDPDFQFLLVYNHFTENQIVKIRLKKLVELLYSNPDFHPKSARSESHLTWLEYLRCFILTTARPACSDQQVLAAIYDVVG